MGLRRVGGEAVEVVIKWTVVAYCVALLHFLFNLIKGIAHKHKRSYLSYLLSTNAVIALKRPSISAMRGFCTPPAGPTHRPS